MAKKFSILRSFKIRYKLLIAFLLIFFPLAIISFGIIYIYMHQVMKENIESELKNTTQTLVNLINTASEVSIKNRLRAIADKNREIAAFYYAQYQSGKISQKKAIELAEEIFAQQTIGKTGYIYCINSRGTAVYHPRKGVMGTNYLDFKFIQKQIKRKEGYIEYNWKNPGERTERPKALYMTYFEPLDWIISVSTYQEEFNYLIDVDDFKASVEAVQFGQSGYAFMVDLEGNVLIHPNLPKMNMFEQDTFSADVIRKIIDIKNGQFHYHWQNPGETEPREKIVIFITLPQYKWIIASSGYVEEVYEPIYRARNILLFALMLLLAMASFLSFRINDAIAKPLNLLMTRFAEGAAGNLSVRMDYKAADELGHLSNYFNHFMSKLEEYNKRLTEEIEERRLAQEALEINESKLKATFNQSFQFLSLLSISGEIIEINQTVQDYFNIPVDSLSGKPLWKAPWYGEDKNVIQQIKKAVQKAASGQISRFETTHLHDNELRNIDVSIKPIYNETGEVIFLIEESRDITRIKRAEQHALATISHLSIVLVKTNLIDDTIEYLSPSIYQITGYTADEWQAMGRREFLDHIHPDDQDQFSAQSAQLFAGHFAENAHCASTEIRFKNRAGEYKWFETERKVLFDQNGKALSVIGYLREISREKEAERQLNETRALLLTAIEKTPAGIIIADAPEGTIRMANSAALGMPGRTDKPLTRIPLELHPSNWQVYHMNGELFKPEDLPLSQAVMHGKTITNKEAIIKRADGEERYVLASASPIRDKEGNIIAGVVVFPDITERIKAEDQLQKYRHLVSSSRDLLALIDKNLVFQAVSNSYATYFNKPKHEIVGSLFTDILGRENYSKFAKEHVESCLQGNEAKFQIWINFPGNFQRYLDVSLSPHYGGIRNREIVGLVSIARDMTDTRQLEDRLRQSQKMEAMGTLAGGIAHDFNNILAAIFGFVQMASLKVDDKSKVEKYLEEVKKAAIRARDLVKQILTFSRKTDIERIPLDMIPIIKETLKFLRASLPATIEIQQQFKIKEAIVLADPTQIHQIFMNLCTNAAHAMREKGGMLEIALQEEYLNTGQEVRLGEIQPGLYYELMVRDTGYGMSPEIMEKIFDPFFTTKERGEGTGMGLSVVHGIIKDMGGDISVYSQVNKGTTFHILFPAYLEKDKQEEQQELDLKMGSGHILVVDDEVPILESGQILLENLGYRVTVCNSSEEALNIYKKQPDKFDLILTDNTMPHMTGLELSRKILAIDPHLPILLTTGYSAGITLEQVREIGLRGMVMKPLIIHELAEAVYAALNDN